MQDDLISRKDALASIKNLYPDMPIVDIFRARRKWLEKYAPYFECENAIEQLPPVNPQETKWISVSERLPKIAGIYRVTRYYPNNVMNPNYIVDACCFDGSNTWYDDNRINYDRAYADNVIAWQENPEPYKVEPQESEG